MVLLFVKPVPVVSLKLYISSNTYLEKTSINAKVRMDSAPYT